MPKCIECKNWDKEFMACVLGPYDIEQTECLLKNILAVLLNQSDVEGEDWKI